LVALVTVLMGTFRRHGGLLRPLAGVLAVVGLLALGLAISNLATKNPAMLPLMWAQATLPGVFCAWLLLGPQFRLMPQAWQVRLGVV
jgi:lipopolysaccharide export system permease protein